MVSESDRTYTMLAKRLVHVSTMTLVLGIVATTLASEYTIDWHTVDGGGHSSVGGSFELDGAIGQSDAGAMTGGNFELAGGFWPIAADIPVVLGDCDGNSLIDLSDYGCFNACFAGPRIGLMTGCDPFDFDGDDDVDVMDFAVFQMRFNGL